MFIVYYRNTFSVHRSEKIVFRRMRLHENRNEKANVFQLSKFYLDIVVGGEI